MNSRSVLRFNKWRKVILISTLLLGFSYISAFCQTSSAPIIFTKKEIAFFKWDYFKRDGKDYGIFIPKVLSIDGDDNLYFLYSNLLVYVVPADGKTVKTIDWGNMGGLAFVDENGNLYSRIFNKKGETAGFILTKPDGSKIEYKNVSSVKNGIAYDASKQKSITITDEGDKPERLPAQLHWTGDSYHREYIIFTDKLNAHLKKINRHIDQDKIQINIKVKDNLHPPVDLIGVSDDCDTYFFVPFQSQVRDGPWDEADVWVYSPHGQKIAEIPLELDFFSKQTFNKEVLINIHGDVYQMWVSQEGVHITKWVKD